MRPNFSRGFWPGDLVRTTIDNGWVYRAIDGSSTDHFTMSLGVTALAVAQLMTKHTDDLTSRPLITIWLCIVTSTGQLGWTSTHMMERLNG